MKHWNICIQYWLAVNVYKRFPSKKYRTAVTMLISSFWHGVYMGYYVCIGTAPLALVVEDVYYKLYLKDGKGKVIKSTVLLFCNYHNLIIFSILKFWNGFTGSLECTSCHTKQLPSFYSKLI
jgi:D-alanyl-lipoteichoic acid acyltransferase DltB (MBOAT superfamily)